MTALTAEFILDVVDSVEEGVVGMVIETYKHPTDANVRSTGRFMLGFDFLMTHHLGLEEREMGYRG